MKHRFMDRWPEQRERISIRLRYGRQKRLFRCPACRRIHSVPVGKGQSKLTCIRCGEIFLRRT